MNFIAPNIIPLSTDDTGAIIDLRAQDQQQLLNVDQPADEAGYRFLKASTTARLGLGRVGTRYTTRSVLRLRADHAAARDAVWTDVSTRFIEQQGFVPFQSVCESESEYLTRPDRGRQLSPDTLKRVQALYPTNPRVLIAVSDGLSSAAIEANVADVIPAITQGLALDHLTIGPIPFIRFARVGTEDYLGEATQADVVCLLIGERPGLVTAKSMSAYLGYRPTVGMPEARRTVVSNIHPGGVPAVEAGAYLADLIKEMLAKRASGLALNA